jgi:cyclase
MIKKRIIPTLTYRNNGLVKSTNFQLYRFLGDPIQTIGIYNLRDVDELIFNDISTLYERPNFELINRILSECYMPITIGGGISSIKDISRLLRAGADKVCLSTAAIKNRAFVIEAINMFGGQAIVIAIDYVQVSTQRKLFTNPGALTYDVDVVHYIKEMSELGISEFILTSVDKEGTLSGYDLSLIKEIESLIETGLVVNGGARNYEDMLQVFQSTHAVGVGAASMFHFTEQTPNEARRYLNKYGIATRR